MNHRPGWSADRVILTKHARVEHLSAGRDVVGGTVEPVTAHGCAIDNRRPWIQCDMDASDDGRPGASRGTPSASYLRSQRQLAQLSLRQLAELTKVSNPYLSQIERGLHQPSINVIKSLATGAQPLGRATCWPMPPTS